MVEVSFCYLSSAMDLFILVLILGCLAAISFFTEVIFEVVEGDFSFGWDAFPMVDGSVSFLFYSLIIGV
jgi:hypothetical protein